MMAKLKRGSLVLGYVFIGFGMLFIALGILVAIRVGGTVGAGFAVPAAIAIVVGVLRIIRVRKEST
jgi:hypothetical protein